MPTDPNTDSMSGLVGTAYNLARQQALGGWHIELLGLARAQRPAKASVSPDGVRLLPVRPWYWCRVGAYDFRYYAPIALRLAFRAPADIHHVYANPYLLSLGRAHKLVLHFLTAVPEVPPAFVRAARRAHAVICCSAFIRNQLLGRVAYPPEAAHVVHNGVDLDRFKPGDKQAARAILSLPSEDLIILYAGAVHPEKGLIHLVRAVKALSSRQPIHLVVAGSASLWGNVESGRLSETRAPTPYEKQVQDEARTLNVTFLGRVAHGAMPLVYEAADIEVCPSVCHDAFPTCNLEAMATGLPVVASNVGGIPEAVTDGVTGFLVPPASPGALASCLDLLLDSAELRAEMGTNGLNAARGFDWRVIARQVRSVYSTLMDLD